MVFLVAKNHNDLLRDKFCERIASVVERRSESAASTTKQTAIRGGPSSRTVALSVNFWTAGNVGERRTPTLVRLKLRRGLDAPQIPRGRGGSF
jgi:hypothetical protein